MGALLGIVAIIMVFSIPLSAIIGGFYIKNKKMNMEQNGSGGAISDLRKEVGQLMAENEEMKERIKNLEYILSDEARKISLDYEKEQIKLDKQNKFEL